MTDIKVTYDDLYPFIEPTDYFYSYEAFIKDADAFSHQDIIDVELLCTAFWETYQKDQSWEFTSVRMVVLYALQHHNITIPPEHWRCFAPVPLSELDMMLEHAPVPAPPKIDFSFKATRRGFYGIDWQDKYMDHWYQSYASGLVGSIYTDDDIVQELDNGIYEMEPISTHGSDGDAYFFGWLTTFQYNVGIEVFDKSPSIFFRDHETQGLQDIYFSTFLSRLSRPAS